MGKIWKRDPHQLAADINLAFETLFLNVRNGYTLAAVLEANQVQRLTKAQVPVHLITQMAREVVMIQNGVE